MQLQGATRGRSFEMENSKLGCRLDQKGFLSGGKYQPGADATTIAYPLGEPEARSAGASVLLASRADGWWIFVVGAS